MKLWLLAPVKPLGEGKSRLAGVLSPAMRADLMRQWLGHLLACAGACSFLAGSIVVSRDGQVHTMARAAGAFALAESGHDLNLALDQARQAAMARQADAILVLPADLPLLTVADIEQLYSLAVGGAQSGNPLAPRHPEGTRPASGAPFGPGIVIAPGRNGGTNALLLRPPMAIDFAFGPGSFQRHSDLAAAQALPCRVYDSPTLAFDIDIVEDLEELYSLAR
jgi:2-phospho-L-lactate guanylyltransferase